MRFAKMPSWVQKLFPHRVWRIPTSEKKLYLTFDDGPVPEVTPFVLETLSAHGAKATFFCVGDNVRKHPDIFRRVLEAGHAVGNHTQHHLNGWETPTGDYLDNVAKCAEQVRSRLFRPPYGRLRPQQAALLRAQYDIVMWDVLGMDYDPNISGEQCLQNILRNASPGSIVVLHDSLKAERNLRYALPRALEHFRAEGFVFESLPIEGWGKRGG
jgi:peptidoglycan/xylan/chitin deacetylase (PgdA/CDA1 family)